jgi:hypothetical protein
MGPTICFEVDATTLRLYGSTQLNVSVLNDIALCALNSGEALH